MTVTTRATVLTRNGGRYLRQLLKHWSHNLQVEQTPNHGSVTFPRDGWGENWPDDGHASFEALPEALEVRLDASTPEQLNGLKHAVVDHLNRFARKDSPLAFDWK